MKLTLFTTFLLFGIIIAITSLDSVASKSFFGGRGSIKIGGSRPISRPSRPISQPSRPISRPSRPITGGTHTVIVSRPVYRPRVVVYQPSRPGIIVIRPRPVNRRIIITPIYHPRPLYSIYLPLYISHGHSSNPNTHPEPVKVLSDTSCVKPSTQESIFTFCQQKSQAKYPLGSLNSTSASCCATYAELFCYIDHAAEYCTKEADAKALIDKSQQLADYFGSTICRAVPSSATWDSVCAELPQLASAFSANSTQKVDFIAPPPPATSTQSACFTKLQTQKEGDLTKVCQNASLNVWDSERRKLYSSAIYEPCCGMYDLLDCLEFQAEHVCTSGEIEDMKNYQKVSSDAFSSGVCREVPFSSSGAICRGETGAAFGVLPSLFTSVLAVLVAASLMFAAN